MEQIICVNQGMGVFIEPLLVNKYYVVKLTLD